LIIDNIYWERIQLFIEGHVENIELNNKSLILRNLTETKEVQANNVELNGNYFKARFNIAILDNGNYLPSGQYLLIYKGRFEYIAQINNNLTDLDNYELDEEQLNKYLDLETSNDKKNYLLNYFKYTFKKGGNSKKTIYTVFPKISKEVNEFVLQITFNKPKPKPNKIKEKIKTIKNKYNRRMFKIRKLLFKSIFNITKFFHLRKGNTVLFTSDSREEMSGNFEFVYNEMLRQNLEKKYKIHQIF